MITSEQLINQNKLFVKIQWPESQTIQEQWWHKELGCASSEISGDIMTPLEYYLKWRNNESCIVKYTSLVEAQYDFARMKNKIYEEEDIDDVDEIKERASELFENKSGFLTPELIPDLN